MIEYLTKTDSITQDNICDHCVFDYDECNEYRWCCYKAYLRDLEDGEQE